MVPYRSRIGGSEYVGGLRCCPTGWRSRAGHVASGRAVAVLRTPFATRGKVASWLEAESWSKATGACALGGSFATSTGP
ncbi:hypothetical protein OPV22_030785 [Ensete ventricosum]|uniref:Uncharacterized protein n=1 Tax=Ensete ventricosum TaxID=4639 RepID=A0AAV8PUN3_ENSVE|nr:hypothetical protein OPV22_030785 [Ensete ventricosum]